MNKQTQTLLSFSLNIVVISNIFYKILLSDVPEVYGDHVEDEM